MNFQSQDWKDEVIGKTFVPGSLDAKMVEETLKRMGQIVDITGNEQVLSDIINVALFNAMEVQFDRMNVDRKEGNR